MFVRFRQTPNRLQVSLTETRRIAGKVHHEHIAGLGSVGAPPTVPERIEFWRRLHERLAKLSNRLDAATQARVLGDIHARIPMVTPDEQQAFQIENLEEDARLCDVLSEMTSDLAAGHRGTAALAEQAAATAEASAAELAAGAANAKARVERLKNGEAVAGGMTDPEDFETILRMAGWTDGDINHALRLARISEIGGEEAFEEFLKFRQTEVDRREHVLSRTFLRRLLADR